MGSERIAISRDGGVAHVELAREGKFNAMDKEMFEGDRRGVPVARRRPVGAGHPAFRPGPPLHRRPRPPICGEPVPADRRSRPGGRGAAPAHQMAAGRVQRRRGGAAAGDRRDPRRLHRRRGRPRHRLRHPPRLGRRLLPGGRGRRRDHRRSRHAAAAHPSHPGRDRPRARLYRPADGARRRRPGSASSTGSRPTATR